MNSISQIHYIDLLLTEFSQKWIQKVDITDMSFQDYLAKLRLEKDKKVKTLS
jgi:bifunctional DNase/RNase